MSPLDQALVLVGTHTYAARGEAARRQAEAVHTLLGLTSVAVIDVQFAGSPYRCEALETRATLTRDSVRVTRRNGIRKPVVREVFDTLCDEAVSRGIPVFCFANGDVHLSDEAIRLAGGAGYDAVVFSREDYDAASGRSHGMQLSGADVFAFTTDWWRRHRHRFREYILGEPVWDNAYTAVTMCHGRAVIENVRPLVRHERHESAWTPGTGPYAQYTRMLAGLDAWYFDRWCKYEAEVRRLRADGASIEQERAAADAIFAWPPSLAARVMQSGRAAKARLRYLASTIRGA